MAKTQTAQTTKLLLSRAELVLDKFSDLEIKVLAFPFIDRVTEFDQNIKELLPEGNEKDKRPPYRQLNNALIACAPTLTHGFEWYFDKNKNASSYRALAVGTPSNPIKVPSPEELHQLIKIWGQEWTKQYLQSENQFIEDTCEHFIQSLEKLPQDWDWISISPEQLVRDLNSETDLGFQAIPSLLATLLHEQTCTINREHGAQEIRWRKVQGGSGDRIGLFLVSQPFKADFFDGEFHREGYFAYRLDFKVQTQAGRFNEEGYLKPWIFINLSCQRYAHEPLIEPNYDRDISILLGMNKSRLSDYDYEIDSTLVRLVVDNKNRKKDENLPWKLQLPELLSAFKARPLETPTEIFANPLEYGNFGKTDDWDRDEYYIVHAEGYKYESNETTEKGKKKKKGHSLKHGYSFKERGDLTARIFELLEGVLIPDTALESDLLTPKGTTTPMAMRNFEWLSKSNSKKILAGRKKIVADSISRALDGSVMNIFIIHYEQDTYTLVYQKIREAFFLEDSDNFPENVTVQSIPISPNLFHILNPLDVNKKDDDFRDFFEKRLQEWRKLLADRLPKERYNCFAIVEKIFRKKQGIHPTQDIYGLMREACDLENIDSQMVRKVNPQKAENSQKQEEVNSKPSYGKPTQGRVQNAVLDLVLRHTGSLYGSPIDVYEAAKIPKEIANSLDVIALCRRKVNLAKNHIIHYALTVRLRAEGSVDVFFPDDALFPTSGRWIPYPQAGIKLGQFFSEMRHKKKPVKLSNPQLAQFAAKMIAQEWERPTLVLIEAEVWRNQRTKEHNQDGRIWPQLQNAHLLKQKDQLDFHHIQNHNCRYQRDDAQLNNLLGVIRIRTGRETPQYLPDRSWWNEDAEARDLQILSGFFDTSVEGLLHYFSIGNLPSTQKGQDSKTVRELYMLDRDSEREEYGANIAFKHQQIVEMLPFFVRADFQTEEYLKALCRVPHYLRFSPAWTMGNIVLPYPMHLGEQLIQDRLCILGATE